MTTDTVDLQSIMENAEREQRKRRDLPARRLWVSGVILGGAGGVCAFGLACAAWANTDWEQARESLNPFLLAVAILGGIFMGFSVLIRATLRAVDELRTEQRRAKQEQRDKIKADMTELVTSAEVERVRREHHQRGLAEARHEELRGDLSGAVGSMLAMLARWGQRLERAVTAEPHAPVPRSRRRRRRAEVVADVEGKAPVVNLEDARMLKRIDEKIKGKKPDG